VKYRHQEIRQPAVAGSFYPSDPAELNGMIEELLANIPDSTEPTPKAIIAPHAGYIYSGPIAASVYAQLRNVHSTITRIILLGPSHRILLNGMAVSSAKQFATPLGLIPIDIDAVQQILNLPSVKISDEAHRLEHSLEVHLPFLQKCIDHFSLVPIVVGQTSTQDVATVLDTLWGGDETLIVVSSDLSHYNNYRTAQELDKRTALAIHDLQPEKIDGYDACGCYPLNGLLTLAKQKGLSAEIVDLRNSGDTAGTTDQVVGYGAFAFH
jgi:AmmeMemoRadiSam system protein B